MSPEDPTDLDLPPSEGLSERGLSAWQEFLGSKVTRSFAIGTDGRFGWASAYSNARRAESRALEACNEGKQSERPEVEDACTIHCTVTKQLIYRGFVFDHSEELETQYRIRLALPAGNSSV